MKIPTYDKKMFVIKYAMPFFFNKTSILNLIQFYFTQLSVSQCKVKANCVQCIPTYKNDTQSNDNNK